MQKSTKQNLINISSKTMSFFTVLISLLKWVEFAMIPSYAIVIPAGICLVGQSLIKYAPTNVTKGMQQLSELVDANCDMDIDIDEATSLIGKLNSAVDRSSATYSARTAAETTIDNEPHTEMPTHRTLVEENVLPANRTTTSRAFVDSVTHERFILNID